MNYFKSFSNNIKQAGVSVQVRSFFSHNCVDFVGSDLPFFKAIFYANKNKRRKTNKV